MTIKIKRPTVEIVELASGNCTYKVACSNWDNDYFRTCSFLGTKKAEKMAENFLTMFDKEATAIEQGTEHPYFIMGVRVDHKEFIKRRKLVDHKLAH